MTARACYYCLLVVFLAITTAANAAEKPKLAPLDIFELEYASDPQISPDGKQVVYVRRSMDIMRDRRQGRLWIVGTDGAQHRKLTAADANESSPRWSPDGSRVAYVTEGKDGQEITLLWLATGQSARLTQLPATPSSLAWSPDGKQIAFSMFVDAKPEKLADAPDAPKDADWADPPRVITMLKHEDDGRGRRKPGYHHLFVLPAEGGTPRQITDGDFHHRGPVRWTPDGESLLFSANRDPDWEYNYRDSEIYVASLTDGSIEALTDRNGPDYAVAVSPDGKQIAYVSHEDEMQTYQVSALHLMNRDGSEQRIVTGQLDRDVESLTWDADGTGLYFAYDNQGRTVLAHTNLSGEVTTVSDDLGGETIGSPSSSGSYSVANDGTIAYTQASLGRPADVAICSLGEQPRRVTDLNSDLLDYRTLGEKEEFWYESSFDGRKIQAWLVKPPHFDPEKKYPLILRIHGGPISNYARWFSAELQLSAAAGYVVLYANPHGSTGYGAEFGNLLHHDFPGHDYDDLMSGVDAVVKRGFIDTEQLYATGGSAGGTMTAWIVGTNDRFRAAVVVNPVINWLSKTLVADNYYAYHNNRYPGLPWENPAGYLRDSPLMLASNVTTPTMIMVGTSDLRTPPSEAKQFYHALKLRKVDTALVEIPGASHNISKRPSHLIAKMAHTHAWFEKFAPKADEDASNTNN